MKKHFPLFLLVGFCAAIISCNNKSGSGEAYVLKMRLNEGDSFNQNADIGMKMLMKMGGMDMDMNMDMKTSCAFNVLDTTPDTRNVEMTYKKLDMTTEIKGLPTGDQTMNNTEQIRGMIGKKVVLKLNNKNEITDIHGFEEAFYGDSTDLATREMMKKMFSKEQMNGIFGMMFQMYPDKPVKEGESWNRETEVSMAGLTMKIFLTYKLLSVKDNIASIEMKGKYKGDGKMNSAGVDIDMSMDGGQDGRFNVGLDNGYIRNGQYTMEASATIKVMEQSVPMTLKGTYTIKND